MFDPTKEQQLLEALRCAEAFGNIPAIDSAVNRLALYYTTTETFMVAAPFWRRGAELLALRTSQTAPELGNYLLNMAASCLIPAGLLDEARTTLLSAKAIYTLHFGAWDAGLKEVDQLLRQIETGA